jgi:hypothetical protein
MGDICDSLISCLEKGLNCVIAKKRSPIGTTDKESNVVEPFLILLKSGSHTVG